MHLIRPVTMTFYTNSASAEWRDPLQFTLGAVSVKMHPGEEPETLTLRAFAEVPLVGLPNVAPDNRVEVRLEARKKAERAIEASANLIAVFTNCRRTISSHHPPVAFLPYDGLEAAWLNERTGIAIPARVRAVHNIGTAISRDLLSQLADRRAGVALLAESLAHEHPTGRFHELVRFFEAAFALSYRHNQLSKNLARFLAGNGFGFTRDEIERWFGEVRDPVTHADRRSDFALESVTRPIVDRMEQAAYDVLFNKTTWHSRDVVRRRVWVPEGGMTSPRGDAVVRVQGSTAPFYAQLLDVFGAYPLHCGQRWPLLPENAWIGDAETQSAVKSEQARIEVIRRPSDDGPVRDILGGRAMLRRDALTATPKSPASQ